MALAKRGDTVRVHYTGRLEDGTVFDTSRSRHPLQFTLGNGQVIAGFENAIAGMNIGESKTTVIPVEQAYGPRRDDMIVTVKRDELPHDLDAKIGQRLELTQMDNRTILVTVTNVTESSLTLDANHPLAGRTLTFDIELVGIV
ncbi:MAG TPA: peptidylprolyl isomerase [Nitrospirota bacterium]|nr:peptidylprolyl isomerase [Nitrospirota bacterium]